MLHEIAGYVETEEMMRQNYIQVGEHIYIKPGQKLSVESMNDEEKKCQVVLPMGGKGTRLLHITRDQFSKHMIEVQGKPLCRYTYDLWRNQGFHNFRHTMTFGFSCTEVNKRAHEQSA